MKREKQNKAAGIMDVAFSIALMAVLLISLNIAIFFVPAQNSFAYPKLSTGNQTGYVMDTAFISGDNIIHAISDAVTSLVSVSTILGG